MSEVNYWIKKFEESEKRYQDALQRARKNCAEYVVEAIFPEQYTDEHILTELLEFFKGYYDNSNIKAIDVEPWMNWVEKKIREMHENKAKSAKTDDTRDRLMKSAVEQLISDCEDENDWNSVYVDDSNDAKEVMFVDILKWLDTK